MPTEKSIPELFFDRCIAEGATLHVWYAGARFKMMTTKTKVHGCIYDDDFEELNRWGFVKFVPSEELATIYRRNHREIDAWLDEKRRQFCESKGVRV